MMAEHVPEANRTQEWRNAHEFSNQQRQQPNSKNQRERMELLLSIVLEA